MDHFIIGLIRVELTTAFTKHSILKIWRPKFIKGKVQLHDLTQLKVNHFNPRAFCITIEDMTYTFPDMPLIEVLAFYLSKEICSLEKQPRMLKESLRKCCTP